MLVEVSTFYTHGNDFNKIQDTTRNKINVLLLTYPAVHSLLFISIYISFKYTSFHHIPNKNAQLHVAIEHIGGMHITSDEHSIHLYSYIYITTLKSPSSFIR